MTLIGLIALVTLLFLLPPSVYSVGWVWLDEPAVAEEEPETLTDLGEWTITAYCPCEKCCGKWALNRPGGVVYGASGIELGRGSCASPLPSGTVLEIEGLGTYTVHDKTADWIVDKYGGRIVDIYFEEHEEALRFGKREAGVWLVEEGG